LLLSLSSVRADTPGAGQLDKLPTASQRFANLDKAEEPSFRRHVIPMFSRLGCSGRECHGSFAGQGGFQLSLFGYDFDADHKQITQNADGGEAEVRINLKEPKESLVVTKPTVQVKHKGKERIKKDSWEYNLLVKWIAGGAKNDTEKTGDFDRLEVFPREIQFKKPGEVVQLKVLAYWKDGTVEDVTELTRFRSNDDSVSVVSDTGRVECKDKGDTHIVAFYDNGVLPLQIILPVTDQVGPRYPQVATRTRVDELVVNKLRKLGIVPSEVCTDAEFLRRASLDIAGTLPTPDEVTRFMADTNPGKRSAKIEELLKTPGYSAWWTTKLCDFTGNNPRTLNTGGVANYAQAYSRHWYDWIHRRVADNEPYDKLAAEIILSSSRSKPDQSYKDFALEMATYFRSENPVSFADHPTLPQFWQRNNVRKAEEKALAFSHTFLGVRIECAQCHKHPFDQWTKTDFQQFQAFFEPVQFGAGPATKGEEISFSSVAQQIKASIDKPDGSEQRKAMQAEYMRRINAGEVAPWQELYINNNKLKKPAPKPQNKGQNYAGRVLTPRILGGEEVHLTQYKDPREPLVEWLHEKRNPYFARAFVNRVWANYFGRGIVEPADDMNLANPPVNRELFDYLADGFISHGYDMKWLHREIVNSDAYQRSWKTNPGNRLDEKNFSRMVIRRLPAEIVLDAMTQATASSEMLPKLAAAVDGRAIGPNAAAAYGKERSAGDQYALTLFGRPAREANCDCERTTDPTLLQTIYTRNDPSLLSRIESARRGQPAWIDELRAAANGKAPGAGDGDGPKQRLKNLEQKVAAMKPPQKPASDDPEALKRYESEHARYQARLDEVNQRRKEIEGLIPITPPAPAFNVDKVIGEVFLRTVSRPPNADEMQRARADLAAARNPVDGVRDLLWAMLNTREFVVNH
jgi:hypothetical protein